MANQQYQSSIHLTILSGSDIKVPWFVANQKYVVAWVDPKKKEQTKTVNNGNLKVQWDEQLTIQFSNSPNTSNEKRLTMEVRAGGSLLGTVSLPLTELALDGDAKANTILTYQLLQSSGKKNGSLSFMAKIMKPANNSSMQIPVMNSYMNQSPVLQSTSPYDVAPPPPARSDLISDIIYPPVECVTSAPNPVIAQPYAFSAQAQVPYPYPPPPPDPYPPMYSNPQYPPIALPFSPPYSAPPPVYNVPPPYPPSTVCSRPVYPPCCAYSCPYPPR